MIMPSGMVGRIFGGLLLACAGLSASAQEPVTTLTVPDAEIVHVLNRITFGPRPGDVEMVKKIGLRNYIEQQLHPESIDDSAVEREVSTFELLQESPTQLMGLIIAERQRAKEKKAVESAASAASGMPAAAAAGAATAMPPPPMAPGNFRQQMDAHRSVAVVGQLEAARLVRAVDSQRQLKEVLVDFWTNHFNIDVKKGPCRVLKVVDDRDVIRPNVLGKFRDLLEASAKSPAMLFYLDNAENSVARQLTPRQLAMVEAFKEKMTGETNEDAAVPPPTGGKKMGGINENYAREIMELHTLGVDGGYTQKDVQEVARCFTGWTIERQTGEFTFKPFRHDNGQKIVLGHVIPAGGGMRDGELVLDILASQPATAHQISRELCQRFVSDDPPEALVSRIAGVFQQTGGDLRQVTEAILTSPEFLSPSSYQTKIKSPLEFAVSAVRATDSTIVAKESPPFDRIKATMEGSAALGREKASDRLSAAKRQSLNWHIFELGEPLFACTPPTGYKEVSKIWVSPGALIERLNFAMALTQQQVEDVRFDPQNILTSVDLDKPEAVLDQCAAALLQGNMSAGTRGVLEQAALPAAGESKTINPAKLIALMLGSPEFQRK
jgi:uncharacterized protein (DUF1800 family)